MGGNGSFSKIVGMEPTNEKTHIELGSRIMGHKILLSKDDVEHIKTPVNSHSENPTYLCAKVDKNGNITIETIAKYKDHKLVETIDIKVDKNGNLLPYNNGKGTHKHTWNVSDSGRVGRESHSKSNTSPVSDEDMELIQKIIDFNKKKQKWKK